MSTSDPGAPRVRAQWTRAPGVIIAMMSLLLVAPVTGQTVLKIGTLMPEGSSWVTALRDIDSEIRSETEGQVRLKIYPGGVQGDEDVMLRKIRIGQLHGAGLGGTGISHVLPDVLALEMPFLFDDYDEVDYVLGQMEGYYRQGFLDAGFVLLGWSDIGFVYLMSQQPIRSVEDLAGHKVWRLQDEPITGVLFEKARVTSVPLTIPDVLLGLQTNLVDVVYASASVAIVLQWFTRVKYYTDLPINYSIGAFLVQQKAFDRMTTAQQRLLLEISARHMGAHNQRSRTDNHDALQIMRREGIVAVASSPEAVDSFQRLVRESTPELVGHAFSRQAHELVHRHLSEFRASPPSQ
jgi:TRAP-type C4-dicarboxylate transport system substrate-binding protein